MLSKREESLLGYVLSNIVNAKKEIDVLRQRLHEVPGFDPHSVFAFLDRAHKGYLTSHDLASFLRLYKVFITTHDADELIAMYDSTGTAQMLYRDFERLVQPSDLLQRVLFASASASAPASAPQPRPEDKSALNEQNKALALLLLEEVETNKMLRLSRTSLRSASGFSLFVGFSAIDKGKQGRITPEDLMQFIQLTGYHATKDDALALFKKCSIGSTTSLSYQEFARILMPLEGSLSTGNDRVPLADPRLVLIKDVVNSPLVSKAELPLPSVFTTPLKSGSTSATVSPTKTLTPELKLAMQTMGANSTLRSEVATATPDSGKRYESLRTTRLDSKESLAPIEKPPQVYMDALTAEIKQMREVEAAKQTLALQADFNVKQGYCYFDCKQRGAITYGELASALDQLEAHIPSEDQLIFFRRRSNHSTFTITSCIR